MCSQADSIDTASEGVIIYAARDETIRLFSLNEKGELDAIS